MFIQVEMSRNHSRRVTGADWVVTRSSNQSSETIAAFDDKPVYHREPDIE